MTLEKIVYVVWAPADVSRAGLGAKLLEGCAKPLLEQGARRLQINVADEHADLAAPGFGAADLVGIKWRANPGGQVSAIRYFDKTSHQRVDGHVHDSEDSARDIIHPDFHPRMRLSVFVLVGRRFRRHWHWSLRRVCGDYGVRSRDRIPALSTTISGG